MIRAYLRVETLLANDPGASAESIVRALRKRLTDRAPLPAAVAGPGL